ncbi:xylanase [Melioribacter roseus P3M-2]|uniref:endo-1,4-beta-xylanase n=1 Tax=Melioribacter roseus (strain DSM 23840 / JCM 17771 / VKM B-2668 / P3M-2) TaxID=1191523 RepID=I7A603_MELRP|nr:endo-1,4-beta-xylanase [Melioribacter roseus]AFN75321.1 xylanase [Melioribacter roseus P3M-2]
MGGKLKNIINGLIILLLLIPSISQAQLVTNGSFENTPLGPVTENIEGWIIEVGSSVTTPPDFEIVDNPVQHGNHAFKVVINSLGANDWDIQLVADSIPVKPGDTYVYSIWAKAEKAGAQANFTVGNYSYNEYGAIRPANLTTEWREFTMEFTITDTQKVIRAPIHFNKSVNVGNTIYVDNLTIINKNDLPSPLKPIVLEAEDGQLGSDLEVLQDGDITYVTPKTNFINSTNPGSASKVITFEVTFADTGNYDLFAKIRVGPNQYNDDSFFYGNGFGVKDTANDEDWIIANQMQAAGFNEPDNIVSDPGGLGDGVWKWVNLSKNNFGEDPVVFTVEGDTLTKIFQIAAREDGLDIDKIAFGKSYLYYTVDNLENKTAGVDKLPGEIWMGPPIASKQPKFLGSAYSTAQAPNFAAYWNAVTPENAGKWGSVESARDQMNWGGLDAAYNLAKENGFKFIYHVLVWGQQQPGWINNLQPDEQLEEIREWFQAVADRYPDIDYLQVVNEPLPNHAPAQYRNALGGEGSTGWDWVINAFKMAREIFPSKTKLMINDYNIINSSANTSAYLKLIRLLQAENLIDVIGVQGHAFSLNTAVSVIKKNLDSLASTGLKIQVTELDIDGMTDERQLQDYQRIFPVLWEHPAVEGITLWGWRPGLWRNEQKAYLVDANGTERPALVWLRNYLDSVVVSVERIDDLPKDFYLSNNYPNPFNPSTRINYSLSKSVNVSLKVYDVLGREVRTLVQGAQNPGSYTVIFDASDLSSGIYFYRLEAGNFSETKQMLLMK